MTPERTTKIRWTKHSWNPVTGCTQVSPGCDNCYALRIAEGRRGTPAFPVGFDIQLRPHKIREPFTWKQPARIFVNSMSDLFHRDIPDDYLRQVWSTMLEAHWHTYQILTKRAHRMAHKIAELQLPTAPHIWLGVSAENQELADSRLPALISIPSAVRFVSAEPLLGPIDFSEHIDDIQWIIDGGESGPGRRHADYDWFRQIRDLCQASGTAYFHKQGNHYYSDRDTELDGQTFDEYPVVGGLI